jgi:dienelactone hydrolase
MSAPETPLRGGRAWLRKGLRLGLWLVGTVAALALLLVGALLVLARGGPAPYVWNPPPAPPVEATGPGTFAVSATPASAPADVPVSIEVTGVRPRASVLVVATAEDARGVVFESWARFAANGDGRLDPGAVAPLEGSYGSVDPCGLLWSMRAPDGSLFATSSTWDRREVRLRVVSDGRAREVAIERLYPYPGVAQREVGGARWRGLLTVPSQGGPFPGVVVLGGWGDGPLPLTSALIARRGFAVLDVGYHGWAGLPAELVEIPVESVTDALDYLEERPEVAPGGFGLYGISRGSGLGLLAASLDPRIVAVAAWVPGSEVFPGISLRSLRQRSAWTWRGQPVPFARAPLGLDTLGVAARLALRRPTSFLPTYTAALAASDQRSAIPVERIAGEVLVAAGGDDRVWPSAEMAERICRRMGPERCTPRIYPEAGHGLRYVLWPGGDFTEHSMIRGGTPEANHLAGRDAWAETLRLFERRLGPERPER